jgi:hypothetical protein
LISVNTDARKRRLDKAQTPERHQSCRRADGQASIESGGRGLRSINIGATDPGADPAQGLFGSAAYIDVRAETNRAHRRRELARQAGTLQAGQIVSVAA